MFTATDDSGKVTIKVTANSTDVPFTDGIAEFTPSEAGTYEIVVIAIDEAGNYIESKCSIIVNQGSQQSENPNITLQVNEGFNTAEINKAVPISFSAIDSDGIDLVSLKVNNVELPVVNGIATFTPDKVGEYIITAYAKDKKGNVTQKEVKLQVIDSSITSVPTINLESLADGQVIKAPTDIIGSVSAEGLVNYKLEYSPAGEDNYKTFAEGNAAVDNGKLGTFDPTLLQNGLYTIRFTGNGASKKNII